ncbi:MAG: hypothetical protein H6658_17505 [Ardenticatenaceae bacterium]|nr:hypothetical protein [Ardenticatenaceae bacterium]
MRPRTFILVILIVVVLAVLAVLYFISRSNGALGGGDEQATETQEGEVADGEQGPVEPLPTATPAVFLQNVIVAKYDLPVGTRLSEDLLEMEQRPNTNIALQGGYAFDNIEELVGQLIKVDIQKGDAVLRPMLAIEAADLASFGSDLSLYVDRGKVAVAFPLYPFVTPSLLPIEYLNASLNEGGDVLLQILQRVAQEKGIAFSMRPGDHVDIMMTAQIVEIDPEFRTALPNVSERVIESELAEGFLFFFPETSQGRLQFIPEINQVVQIVPSFVSNASLDGPIPKRVTQLAIQQAEVLWVGTWFNREELEKLVFETSLNSAAGQASNQEGEEATDEGAEQQVFFDELPSAPSRLNLRPDVVILSMEPQDAIALKWAIERGIDIDLALRAQGDEQSFETASVSLFQIIEQGGVAVPPPVDFDLQPRPEGVTIPVIPDSILSLNITTAGTDTVIEYQEIYTGLDSSGQ